MFLLLSETWKMSGISSVILCPAYVQRLYWFTPLNIFALFPLDEIPNDAEAAPISLANMVQNALTNISFVLELLLSGGDMDLCLQNLAVCGGLSIPCYACGQACEPFTCCGGYCPG